MLFFKTRIKKNLTIKTYYALFSGADGFIVFFHNNKKFTEFKSKVLVPNGLQTFVIKNTLFFNLAPGAKRNPDDYFKVLMCGPSVLVSLTTSVEFLTFFRFYFQLYNSGELDLVICLGGYSLGNNTFFSLEYVNSIIIEMSKFPSIDDFMLFKKQALVVSIVQLSLPLIYFFNNFVVYFLFVLNAIYNVKKDEQLKSSN